VVAGDVVAPSTLARDVPPAIDQIVLRGLRQKPSERFATAKEMALAIEKELSVTPSEIAAWVEQVASDALRTRDELVATIEREASGRRNPTSVKDLATHMQASTPTPATAVPVAARRVPWLALGVGSVAVIAVAAYMIETRVKQAAPSPSTSALATTSIAPVVPSFVPSAATSASAAPQPTVVISNAPLVRPVATSSKTATTARPSSTVEPTTAVPPPVNPCDPPYTTDSNGHRHYKPDCFPK
jgi:serine/threonine-protein kinase